MPIFIPVGLDTLVTVRRDDCKIVVARAGGRRVWWSAMELLGRGFFGVRRNPCRKVGTDVVMPMGAAIPS
jgi:hypothetical protein